MRTLLKTGDRVKENLPEIGLGVNDAAAGNRAGVSQDFTMKSKSPFSHPNMKRFRLRLH